MVSRKRDTELFLGCGNPKYLLLSEIGRQCFVPVSITLLIIISDFYAVGTVTCFLICTFAVSK